MREDLLKETELELQEIRRRNEETEQARRREIFLGYPEIRELMEKRENLIQSATVVNKEGPALPSTGGIGTTIFYIVGSVLLLAAAIVLIARRRTAADVA